MSFIVANSGIRWHYNIQGEGKPLVFIHGWGVNMLIWRQQFKYFSQSYKVLTVDLPGHGKTNWQKESLQSIALDFYSVLDELELDKVTLVCSSMGGLIGLRLFEIAPLAIERLIFVGSQPKFARSHDYPYGIDVERIRRLSSQVNTSYPSIINIFFRSLFSHEERQSRRFKWLQTFRKTDIIPEQGALVEWLDVLEKEDLRSVFHAIDLPMQFIYGDEDYICPPELLVYLKEKFPKARFDILQKCGHFPFLSKPHEFNQALENFLKNGH